MSILFVFRIDRFSYVSASYYFTKNESRLELGLENYVTDDGFNSQIILSPDPNNMDQGLFSLAKLMIG